MVENRAEDMRALLSAPMGVKEADYLGALAIQDAAVFDLLAAMLFSEEEPVNWRAAWALEKTSEHSPAAFDRAMRRQLISLLTTNRHVGRQRLGLSILFNLPMDEDTVLSGEFINRLFEQMTAPKEPVGVQVLAMKLLERICTLEPAFIPEMLARLENNTLECYSKGYLAARRGVIERLRKTRELHIGK